MKLKSITLLVLLSVGVTSIAIGAQDEAQKDAIRKSVAAHRITEAQKTQDNVQSGKTQQDLSPAEKERVTSNK
jgi:hypothetical protein